jgi:hypothetical protein
VVTNFLFSCILAISLILEQCCIFLMYYNINIIIFHFIIRPSGLLRSPTVFSLIFGFILRCNSLSTCPVYFCRLLYYLKFLYPVLYISYGFLCWCCSCLRGCSWYSRCARSLGNYFLMLKASLLILKKRSNSPTTQLCRERWVRMFTSYSFKPRH